MTTNHHNCGVGRPMKIVELDDVPRSEWRIEQNAVYLWHGRLWRKEPVGCVLCVEHDDTDHITFAVHERWPSAFVCLKHGELTEIAYELKKVYTITVGDVVREGEERLNDTMLFPTEMTLVERNALIEQLLDEAEEAEAEAGPAPESAD